MLLTPLPLRKVPMALPLFPCTMLRHLPTFNVALVAPWPRPSRLTRGWALPWKRGVSLSVGRRIPGSVWPGCDGRSVLRSRPSARAVLEGAGVCAFQKDRTYSGVAAHALTSAAHFTKLIIVH